MKVDYSLFSYTKNNPKQIKNLNIISEKINYIETEIGTKLMDLGFREDFMNFTSKTRELKATINFGTISNLKALHRKKNHQQNKKATNQMEEHIF